jgi:hypothetical protein
MRTGIILLERLALMKAVTASQPQMAEQDCGEGEENDHGKECLGRSKHHGMGWHRTQREIWSNYLPESWPGEHLLVADVFQQSVVQFQ